MNFIMIAKVLVDSSRKIPRRRYEQERSEILGYVGFLAESIFLFSDIQLTIYIITGTPVKYTKLTNFKGKSADEYQ
jgi:hypothetical protein